MIRSRCLLLAWIALTLVGAGCAKVPSDRYGVQRVRIEGAKRMNAEALRTCLATQERESFSISTNEPSCGKPPFDGKTRKLRLWTWPWSAWPLYDQSALERDLSRIGRWYKARGYYYVKVQAPELKPDDASASDRVESSTDCDRAGKGQGCKLQVRLRVEEGQPIRVGQIQLDGIERLSTDLQQRLWESIQLRLGDRFDEALYDQSKQGLIDVLAENSYARANTQGQVIIDPTTKLAEVHFRIQSGPSCVFGKLSVVGRGNLPARPILATAALKPGEPYKQSAVADAQTAIYALGAFSAVTVEPQIPKEGGKRVIDVIVRVTPGRRFRYGVGAGLQSGRYVGFQSDIQGDDVPQWDVHLLGVIEDRNFLGGIRRLRIEERPRLIFNANFPRIGECCSQPFDTAQNPILGNLTTIDFRQPSFLEGRTALVAGARLDLGPDPFFQQGGYYRLDFDARVGPERYFFNGKLYLYGGLHGNVLQQVNNVSDVPANYQLIFFEQQILVDLRDDPIQPTKGAFFALSAHEAGFILSSWNYVRVTPEARGYVPLPGGLVLAGRFAVGGMFIFSTACEGVADPSQCSLNDISNSNELGPFRYRLRGGGPSSNRGFPTGRLGAGPPGFNGLDGGLRRWEASIELRAPLTKNFGVVAFFDFGDVSQSKEWRWNHLNTTVGGGLRWRTIVGPLRLDVGWLIPKWRVIGGPQTPDQFLANLGFASFPGAINLTIGEAY